MSQWVVPEFMSRVAERVSTAGEGFAAQLTGRRADDPRPVAFVSLDDAFPFVEPSPDFVESLRLQLMEAAVMVPPEVTVTSSMAARRVLYGVAAVGSVASAAAIAVVWYRSRAAGQHSAA